MLCGTHLLRSALRHFTFPRHSLQQILRPIKKYLWIFMKTFDVQVKFYISGCLYVHFFSSYVGKPRINSLGTDFDLASTTPLSNVTLLTYSRITFAITAAIYLACEICRSLGSMSAAVLILIRDSAQSFTTRAP